jgi:hypothetical protein
MKDVPKQAQKAIKAGRLKGMTDISPQWRYHVMTQTFGPIGIGWKFTIDRQWLEDGSYGQSCAFTEISLYVKHEGAWSDAIPGTGGSAFIAKETKTNWDTKVKEDFLYTSDEAYKMSLTDALSVAMKMLGVGAVIYSAGNDYSKYSAPAAPPQQATTINDSQLANLEILIEQTNTDIEQFCKYVKVAELHHLPAADYNPAIKALEIKKGKM